MSYVFSHKHTVKERFLRYVQIDTQSDPNSSSQPSTEKQKDLSRLLVDELQRMGVTDAQLDEHGYVYATIEATTTKDVPTLCFCAHVDTAPDCPGAGVVPRVHTSYQGQEIRFPDDEALVLRPADQPYLNQCIGHDLITASGKTLLGADDKAGVAIIMDFAQYLMDHPEIPHGRIRILFTPDEEIGRGVQKVDMERLRADYGYTLDGGPRGHLEGETFSADAMTIRLEGVSAHPGYAKGVMVSALKGAADLVSRLPKDTWSPESTEGMEGFVHPVSMKGELEKAQIDFIIRSFNTKDLEVYRRRLGEIIDETLAAFPGLKIDVEVKEQYRNMKEVLDKHPQVMDHAAEAYERAGLTVVRQSIRGGTDGSRLSFMGLPCPNLFTGEMAIHSRTEFVSVQDMEKSVEVLAHLVQIWEEQSPRRAG